MRRRTIIALSGILILNACSDQGRESPTAPVAQLSGACTATSFPHSNIVHQVQDVFPSDLRGQAVSRSSAIKKDWNGCQPDLARRGVAEFVSWMNARFVANELTGTAQQRSDLISTLFAAVGLTTPPIVLGSDVGIGVVDPAATTPTRIETDASTALIEFQPAQAGQPAAFDEVTVVTIFRRPDGTFLTGFPEEDQYPPFFDYSATNGSNTHAVATGAVVRMAFCLLGTSRFPAGYPDGVRIGHNPDPTVPGPRFEIIPEDEAVADYAGDLACEELQPRLGSLGGGLIGLARATGSFLAPLARALFLPSPLMAVAVGTRGPLGGLPPSLSDFGVVNATSYFGYEDGEPLWSAGSSFWNRRTAAAASNSAFPVYVSTFNAAGVAGGTLPAPYRVDRSGWYGQLSTGNYIGTQASGDPAGSGGTSTSPNSGVFVSPEIEVPSVSSAVELRFKTWWEIEAVNPSRFDIMSVELEHGGAVTVLKRLNPSADPTSPTLRAALAYTSGGFPNVAPTWKDEAIDISAYRGQTVRIRFAFNTVDHQYNGFRGWMVDDVRISTGTSVEGGPILLRKSAEAAAASLMPADQLPRIPRP